MAKQRKGFAPAIEQAIQAAAQRHGLNPQALRAFARIESSGNPKVQTGSYKGLFQLSNAEFRRYGGRGDIFDPVANANAAAAKLSAESARLEKRLGREPTAGDLYLVHQQGEGGALMHRKNPDQAAWKSMYSTAEGRKKGPEWAQKAIWGNIPAADKKRFGSVENVTSRDFIKLWNDKVAKFGGVKSIAELTIKGNGSPVPETTVAAATVPSVLDSKPSSGHNTQGGAVPSVVAQDPGGRTSTADGMTPGQSAGAGHGVQSQIDVTDVGSGNASSQDMKMANAKAGGWQTEVEPELPTPGEGGSMIAGANSNGGGLFGGTGPLGLKGSIASIFGLGPTAGSTPQGGGGGGIFGLGKGGGGGGFKNLVQVPDMGDTSATFASMESSMGPSGDDILQATLPPPPPRTPEGLPVGNFSEIAKRRRRSQFG